MPVFRQLKRKVGEREQEQSTNPSVVPKDRDVWFYVCTFKCIQMLCRCWGNIRSAVESARYRSHELSSARFCRMSSGRHEAGIRMQSSPSLLSMRSYCKAIFRVTLSNFSSFVYRKDPIFPFAQLSSQYPALRRDLTQTRRWLAQEQPTSGYLSVTEAGLQKKRRRTSHTDVGFATQDNL